MTEPRRLELAWLFGLYARVIPPPGEDGDEMAFAFDGATFTPGEFVADSGGRDVEIELTLDSEAITSGTFMISLIGVSDTDLDADTLLWAATGGGPGDILIDSAGGAFSYLIYDSFGSLYFTHIVIVVAADGHSKITITLANSTAAAGNIYLVLPLPTGAVAVSDAISIPGVGE